MGEGSPWRPCPSGGPDKQKSAAGREDDGQALREPEGTSVVGGLGGKDGFAEQGTFELSLQGAVGSFSGKESEPSRETSVCKSHGNGKCLVCVKEWEHVR